MFGYKGKSLPLSPHTASPAGTMRILLSVSREIPINHMRDMRKIKPLPGNIACNKVAELATPELSNNRRTLILNEPRVHIVNIFKIFSDGAEQRINLVPGITKNEHLINLLPRKIPDEFCMLLFWVGIGEIMLNAFWRHPVCNK